MKRIFYAILSAIMLSSCSREPMDEQSTAQSNLVTVTFGASLSAEVFPMSAMSQEITPDTRAAKPLTMEYAGRIGIADKNGNWVEGYNDIKFAIEKNTGLITTTPAVVQLPEGEAFTFRSLAIPGTVPPKTKDDTYPLNFGKVAITNDFIYGEVKNQAVKGGDKITFAYNHVYGRVKFILTKGDNITDAQLASATLTLSGYYSEGTFDLKTATIAHTPGSSTDLTVDVNTLYYALPQKFAAGQEPTATVTVGEQILVGKISSGDIIANTLNTITIKVTGESPASSASYVGMFGGKIIGAGTEADPFRFEKPLYVQAEDETDVAVAFGEKVSEGTSDVDRIDGRGNTWALRDPKFAVVNLCYKKNSKTEQASEAALKWYLPTDKQLLGVWVTNSANPSPITQYGYWSSTIFISSEDCISKQVSFSNGANNAYYFHEEANVRCVKEEK